MMGTFPEVASPVVFLAAAFGILLAIFADLRRRNSRFYFPIGFWRKRVRFRDTTLPVAMLIGGNVLLLALALAQPYLDQKTGAAHAYQKPVLLIFDVSGSMNGESYRESLKTFNKIQEQDLRASLGLLMYSSDPYIARDFAPDKALLRDTLENEAEVRQISGGTETDKALDLARLHFAKDPTTGPKIAVIVSDFEDYAFDVAKGLNALIEDGVTVFGIGVGQGSINRFAAIQRFLPARTAVMVKFANADDEQGIQEIFDTIRATEGAYTIEGEETTKESLLAPLLLSFLGLLLVTVLLSETSFRKLP